MFGWWCRGLAAGPRSPSAPRFSTGIGTWTWASIWTLYFVQALKSQVPQVPSAAPLLAFPLTTPGGATSGMGRAPRVEQTEFLFRLRGRMLAQNHALDVQMDGVYKSGFVITFVLTVIKVMGGLKGGLRLWVD